MKKLICLTLTLTLIASASFAQDSTLTQVSYSNPEKFTDFETRFGSRDRLDRLKKDFNRNINKLWKKTITNGNNLTINFTDIDMAGRIIFGIEQIRQVRVDSDKSVLEFDFTIKNKNGKVILSGHEKLVNNYLARLDRSTFGFNNSRLKYEVAQMAKWIREKAKEVS